MASEAEIAAVWRDHHVEPTGADMSNECRLAAVILTLRAQLTTAQSRVKTLEEATQVRTGMATRKTHAQIEADTVVALHAIEAAGAIDRAWMHKQSGKLYYECGLTLIEATAEVAILYRPTRLAPEATTLPPWARPWREFIAKFTPVPKAEEQASAIECVRCHRRETDAVFGVGGWKLRSSGDGFVPVCPFCKASP